ncbi:MAG TPA: hypothetical protein DCQ50_10530 [Chryseobacterium sp.]|nr:hypothetical protein [Chryseobacterium sp.]
MSTESYNFYRINKIAKIFIIIILAFCISVNVIEIISLYEFVNIQHRIFVIIILAIFIASLSYENCFTTILLLIFNTLFWNIIINERKDLSWYDDPFAHYNSVLLSFANQFGTILRIFLYKIIRSLNFLNNLIIWIIIIPYRIYKFYLRKNVTT